MAAPKVRTIDKLMLLHRALADDRLGKADVTILATVVEATHSKYGFAWASVASIAQVVGVSRRYVQLALRKLESLGYLRIELGGRGPKSTNRYIPNVEGRSTSSPLAMRPTEAKGEVNRDKGEVQAQKGRSGGSPNTSDYSSYTDTFRSRGAPDDRRAPVAQKNVDPMTLLPERPGAFLAWVERRLRDGDLTVDEAHQWLDELDCLADEYESHTGDPIGGRAQRLYDALADWMMYQHEDV